nr:MAG TPA: hypothetical protein [Siphoviridae sp. ctJZ725]
MEYIVYKRFRGAGIEGEFNLRYGTVVSEIEGFLFASDGRRICAATSENGWEHFRPNTQEGAERQKMLERLYQWYAKHGCGEDFTDDKWPEQENGYWKNRLRTASTERLEKIYREKFGGTSCMQ